MVTILSNYPVCVRPAARKCVTHVAFMLSVRLMMVILAAAALQSGSLTRPTLITWHKTRRRRRRPLQKLRGKTSARLLNDATSGRRANHGSIACSGTDGRLSESIPDPRVPGGGIRISNNGHLWPQLCYKRCRTIMPKKLRDSRSLAFFLAARPFLTKFYTAP